MENRTMINNIILKTDSYKPSQWKQYPKGTTKVYSYFESRQTKTPITFFGLQQILKKHFVGRVVTREKVEQARSFFNQHFGRDDVFNYDGWMYIVEKHNGKLPLKINAVPEGTTVDGSNVLFTVENTDDVCYWLTNYVETILSHVWYASTVATNSRNLRELLIDYAEHTSDSDAESIVNFQMHDFGYRGVSSDETAGMGGLAHLIMFYGTDNLASIAYANEFYNETEMIGFSIPASEHSTMTSWGGPEGEPLAMENMLDSYPTGMIACVSDSFDIMNAVSNIWGDKLRDKILNRDGRLVVRPDSGDPVTSTLKIVEALWSKFGGEINSKGYKVLHPNIRMIQGDGIDFETTVDILKTFEMRGFSSENIAFGSGGGLLQKFNRDTYKFAFKCSSIEINGEEVDVRKFPKEWNENSEYVRSFKTSKKGKVKLYQTVDGKYYTATEPEVFMDNEVMRTVFEDGRLLVDDAFSEIRGRV